MFIVENMRVHQDCRGMLKHADESVPTSPLILICVQLEQSNVHFEIQIQQKEQPAHYYLNLSCICALAQTFVCSSLVVPVYGYKVIAKW